MNPKTEEARRLAGVLRKVIPYEGNEWDLDEAAQALRALADDVERLEAEIASVREACIIEACEFVRSVEEAGELRHRIEALDLAALCAAIDARKE